MSLNANALATVDQFLESIGASRDEFLTPAFRIYNAAAGATSATVTKAANVLTLVVVGGASAHNTALTLTDAANDTITELIAVILALNKGWVINRLCPGAWASTDMADFPATDTLLVANEYNAQIYATGSIESVINRASEFIENYCHRVFTSTFATFTETEYYDGTGSQFLLLRAFPVTSVTSVKEWETSTNAATTTYTEHTDYTVFLDEGIIYRSSGWARRRKGWQVVYVAGYATIPEDLKGACLEIAKLYWAMRDKRGLKSESIGDYSYTTDGLVSSGADGGTGLPSDVVVVLDSYKREDYEV